MSKGTAMKLTDKTLPLSAVVMASGHSVRFGGNKLITPVEGIPMIERLFRTLPQESFSSVVVVAREEAILTLARRYGFTAVHNDDLENDTAKTIFLGMEHISPHSVGCMFFVGDQPWLGTETIQTLCQNFMDRPDRIHLPVHQGRRGNPVVFPASLFEELKNLPPHGVGKAVIGSHPQLVVEQEVSELDLKDVDYASDLNSSEKI